MARLFGNGERELPSQPPLGPDDVAPLSNQRIIQWFEKNDYRYFVDNEQDVGGLWNDRLFYFFTFGQKREILQVRGQWNRKLTVLRRREILEFCNAWNRDRIWPMCYVKVGEYGDVRVYVETSTDLEFGVSDNQLNQLLQCALATGNKFFDTLDEQYPDVAQQAPPSI